MAASDSVSEDGFGLKTILIIDDDMHIGNMTEEVLLREGYHVLRAYSGTEALLLLSGQKPDLVVIVVSAKADVNDKVELLLGGAADYITKPFHTKELLARIAVQLRKAETLCEAACLTFGDITLNAVMHQVAAGGKEVHLTRTEYAILKLLLKNPQQVITKSVLLDRISEDTPDCTESSLKIHVSNLRKKIKEVCGKDYIEAVWGIGFKLRE